MFKYSYFLTQKEIELSYYAYEKYCGALRKSKIALKILFYSVFGTVIGALTGVISNLIPSEEVLGKQEEMFVVLSSAIIGFIAFSVMALMMINHIKKECGKKGYADYRFGFDKTGLFNIEFYEDNVIITSAYKRYTESYDDIKFIISDKSCFTLVLRDNQTLIPFSKNKQNSEKLFLTDNFLREKLGERFIYKVED